MLKKGLTGNQLKLLALVFMTIDHIGFILFPWRTIFRVVGRLALPIYGYMIAEGCRYTRSMPKYLGMMAAVGVLCQVVSFVAERSLYQCIMVTFSLSVCLIWLLKRATETKKVVWYLALAAAIATVFVLTELVPQWLPGFEIDYGFWGVLFPVCVYAAKDRRLRLAATAISMALLSVRYSWIQWFSLAAIPLLALYNGQRGKRGSKYFFYLYYPAHIAALHIINYLWR